MRKRSLVIRADGYSQEAIDRACAAGDRVMAESGADPYAIARAAWLRDGNSPDVTAETEAIDDIWDRAVEAALRAIDPEAQRLPRDVNVLLSRHAHLKEAVRANPARWRAFYDQVLDRLERAGGPDPDLDRDVTGLLGWAEQREPPRCRDGAPFPRFTERLDEVEAFISRDLPGARWTVRTSPLEAFLWDGDVAGSKMPEQGWSGSRPGAPPPANAAIALTLALLRSAAADYGP